MDLTRHERRELAEIEQALVRDAPVLAAYLVDWGESPVEVRPGLIRRLLHRRP